MAESDRARGDQAHSTLVDLLCAKAHEFPERTVYRYLQDGEVESGALTYRELERSARAVAVWLTAHCRAGDRILLFCPSGLEFMIGFFGCVFAGMVAVPVHTPDPNRVRRTLSRLRFIVHDARVAAVLTNRPLLRKIDIDACEEWGISLSHWQAVEALASADTTAWRRPDIDARSLAFLQYTSGSTGDPKGVMIQHGNILENERMIATAMRLGEGTLFATWLPLYHDMGIIGPMLQTVFVGGSAVLMSPLAFIQKPYRWLKAISDYRCSVAGGPSFSYQLCIERIAEEQRATLDLSCWRVAFNGAEPIRSETVTQFSRHFAECGFDRTAFFPCYGMAEATLLVTGAEVGKGAASEAVSRDGLAAHAVRPASAGEASVSIVSCGAPASGVSVRIVDPETRRPASADKIGEIWVRGPNVAAGYWERPEETAQTFGVRIEGEGEEGYLRTGDLGYLRDGSLYVTGRSKEIVIVRGHNYYPHDIERTVEQSHAALQRDGCAAFSINTEDGERLVVVAEIRREAFRKLNAADVVIELQRNLSADFGLALHRVVLLRPGYLLKTTSGKVQRRLIREKLLDRSLEGIAHTWRDDQHVDPDAAATALPAAGIAAELEEPNGAAAVALVAPPRLGVSEIRSWLIEAVARASRRPTRLVNAAEPLSQSGLDSLKLVSLTGELSEWLGQPVAPSIVYDHPSIDALARHLAGIEGPGADASQTSGNSCEPIAVIGMACRFPGAVNCEEFWSLLLQGRNAVVEVPKGRWDIERYYSQRPGEPGKTNSRWGGFIDGIGQFDPLFFGVSPVEAASMDPQQRLIMMLAWEALESAGVAPTALSGSSAGVIVGMSTTDYGQLAVRDLDTLDGYSVTGQTSCIAANRLSFFLNAHGPSLAVDAACASSLAAVHLACHYLRSRASQLMLVGAANAIVAPQSTIALAQAGLLSPDGRCRTFDEEANGYVRGEGGGMLVLKRLSDARRDGDPVIGVIRDVSMNHNGLSNGLKAPNGRAQQSVIARALAGAAVKPSELSYLEAHGTGTRMGDAIELGAIREVFSRSNADDNVCHLGSVKTNIGHLEAASGMAGLIKVLLMLRHETIPRHLHVERPNGSVPLDGTGIRIAQQQTAWSRGERPRRAGVSSFGFGGVNCFAIVEEAVEPSFAERAPAIPAGPRVLALSAQTPAALEELAESYATFLSDAAEDVELADVCYTSQVGRAHLRERAAVVGSSRDEVVNGLAELACGRAARGVVRHEVGGEPHVAFLFSGQGSQYEHMGRKLYDSQPVFRAALDRCAEILQPLLAESLLDVLYPTNGKRGLIHQTRYTQPALFALEYSLFCLWRSWGVTPSVLIGHSIGEYVAACVAGVFSLEDGLALVAQRAALMQSLPESGAMAAVLAGEEVVREIVALSGTGAELACMNSPLSSVISGSVAAVEGAMTVAATRGVHAERLRVSHAFHSRLMEPMLEPFARIAAGTTLRAPAIPMALNVTGALLDGEALSPGYFVEQARKPVRFADGLRALDQTGVTHFLEIGPHTTLLGLGQATLGDESCFAWLPSLREGTDERQQMLETAAALYTCGVAIDWHALHRGESRRRVSVPTYVFQCEHYWLPSPNVAARPAPGLLLQTIDRGDADALTLALARTQAATSVEPAQLHAVAQALVELRAEEQRRESVKDWQFSSVLRESPRAPVPSWRQRRASAGTRYLILADHGGLGRRLGEAFVAQGLSCQVLVEPEELRSQRSEASARGFYEALTNAIGELDGSAALNVLFVAGRDLVHAPGGAAQELVARQLSVLLRLQWTTQVLCSAPPGPRLWIVGGAGQNAGGPAEAPLSGFSKTLALEHPELFGGCIELTAEEDGVLAACIEEIVQPERDRFVVLGEHSRLVPRLTRRGAANTTKIARNFEGAHVITGGFGDLGIRTGRWLAARGARRILVVSRRGARDDAARRYIEELGRLGVEVIAVVADISEERAIEQLRAAIDSSALPVRGAFHCAGVVDDALLVRQTAEQLESVLMPKVAGALNLARALEGQPLESFVLFGSIASVFGSPGQANYAAANAFLEAFAVSRRHAGQPAQCLSFGPWEDTGMMGRLGSGLQERIAAMGFTPMHPDLGVHCLEAALERDEPRLLLAPVDWELAAKNLVPSLWPLVEEFVTAPTKPTTAPESGIRGAFVVASALRGMRSRERRKRLVRYLQDGVAAVLNYPDGVLPDPSQGFFSMGLDSLMVVKLLRGVEAGTGVPLSPSVGFEHPTINELARYLDDGLLPDATGDEDAVEHPAGGRQDESAMPIDALSEDEALNLLEQRIAFHAKEHP